MDVKWGLGGDRSLCQKREVGNEKDSKDLPQQQFDDRDAESKKGPIQVLQNNQTPGYVVNPAHLFNQQEHVSVPRVVVRHTKHYEPIFLPEEANKALKTIYRQAQTPKLQVAPSQLPVACKDGGEGRGELQVKNCSDDGKHCDSTFRDVGTLGHLFEPLSVQCAVQQLD